MMNRLRLSWIAGAAVENLGLQGLITDQDCWERLG